MRRPSFERSPHCGRQRNCDPGVQVARDRKAEQRAPVDAHAAERRRPPGPVDGDTRLKRMRREPVREPGEVSRGVASGAGSVVADRSQRGRDAAQRVEPERLGPVERARPSRAAVGRRASDVRVRRQAPASSRTRARRGRCDRRRARDAPPPCPRRSHGFRRTRGSARSRLRSVRQSLRRDTRAPRNRRCRDRHKQRRCSAETVSSRDRM